MTKKEKLLKYILGLSLAGSISLTGASCGYAKSHYSDDNRKSLAGEVSVDSGMTMFDIYAYELSTEDQKTYITFYGHYDNGIAEWPKREYINHHDYKVKYEISREDYLEIHKHTYKGKTKTDHLTQEAIDKFVEIAVNYTPVYSEELPEVDHLLQQG